MMEIYVSTDVETDGPLPGFNSMLSIGAAAFSANKTLVSVFSTNIEPLPGAAQDAGTMEFWAKNPKAWEACQVNPRAPDKAIQSYKSWVISLPGKPVFVGYPVTFDWLFAYWYLMRFTGHSPFSFAALDIKTLAMVVMGCDFRDAAKRNMPKRWFGSKPHTHIALDDAIEQGELFCTILAEAKALRHNLK